MMAYDIRPEVSQKNPYWIGKHRYYELKHFCLQYPIWKKAYHSLDALSRRPADLQVFVKSGQMKSDPTERCAQSRLFFVDRMEMVEQAAIDADPDLYQYLIRGVTEGLSYDALKMKYDRALMRKGGRLDKICPYRSGAEGQIGGPNEKCKRRRPLSLAPAK